MGKGEDVSMRSLHKICKTFKCDVGDIIEMNDVIDEVYNETKRM